MPLRNGKEPMKKEPTIVLPDSTSSSTSGDEAIAAEEAPAKKKKAFFSSNRFSIKARIKAKKRAKEAVCPLQKCIDAGTCTCPGSQKSSGSTDSGVSVAVQPKGKRSRFSFGRKGPRGGSKTTALPGIKAAISPGASAAVLPSRAAADAGDAADGENDGEGADGPNKRKKLRKKKDPGHEKGGGGSGGGSEARLTRELTNQSNRSQNTKKRHTLANNAEKRTNVPKEDEEKVASTGLSLFQSSSSSSSSSEDDDGGGFPAFVDPKDMPAPYDAKAARAAREAHARQVKLDTVNGGHGGAKRRPTGQSRPTRESSTTSVLGLSIQAPGHGHEYDRKAVRVASARSMASARGQKSARANAHRIEMTEGRGEEWDLLAKMESMEGSKIKKLRAQMQLSQSQLQRITRSFTKYDLEKTGQCDRVMLAKVMEDLGRRPDTEDELDDLFRVTDKDGSGQIDFDEFVNMMVVRVGFKATPGIMLKVVQLDDFKPNGSEKKKGKKKKTKAPTIETNIVGYSTEKAKPKKDNKDPYMRYKDKERGAEKAKAGYSKEGIPYDTEIFMACPQDCQFPLQFELVGDAKVWASGGRLIKDVVACAIFDISKLEDNVEKFTVPVYTPLPTVHRDESDYGSDISGASDGGSSSGLSSGGMSSQGSSQGRRSSRVGLKSGKPPPKSAVGRGRRRSTSILDFELPMERTKVQKSGKPRRVSSGLSQTSNASSAAGSNWEDDLMSVTSSVASAFGTRHRPKTSIVEEFDAVPNLDAQVGVLHIEIQRYLQEAKDQLGLAGRDRLGSGLHHDETDVKATQFDNAEEHLLKICIAENPTNEASEQTYQLGGPVDETWESLDRGELGLVSLSTIQRWLKTHEVLQIMSNFNALKLAFACCKGATRHGNRKEVTRRTWVSFRDFLTLVCHQFYAVRFWDIYERIADGGGVDGDGGGVTSPPHDFESLVDIREFSFILKRAGYKIDGHDPGPGELTAMFEQCSPDPETGPGSGSKVLTKAPLAEVVKIATIKRFFPGVDSRMIAQLQQPNGAKRRASKAPYGKEGGGKGGKMTVGQVGRTKLKAKEARQRHKEKARLGHAR